MTPTHLLIPIDFSVNMEDIDFHLSQIEDYEHGQKGHAITTIRKMIASAKQISLNEEDIVVNEIGRDTWVDQVTMINDIEPIERRLELLKKSLVNIYTAAYKQALKDLIECK